MIKSSYNFIIKILQNPFFILFTVLLGLAIGFYSPQMGQLLKPYGMAFMALLEMSLIPIIVCAIALSISNLMSFKGSDIQSGRIVGILFIVALIVSAISCVFAYFLDPAASFLKSNSLEIKKISTAASFVDRKLNIAITDIVQGGFAHFLTTSIPRNIFESLAENHMLQIIIFSIIFGVAVSYSKKSERLKLQSFFETTLNIFQRIILTITIWLPLAIICLMAGGASDIGFDMMLQMGSFILKVYIVFFIIFFLSTFIIQKRSGCGFFQVLKYLKDPIIISFGTRSAILPIPSILKAFEEKIPVNKSLSKLLVPLGAVLGRFGNIAYFAILAIFMANIYQADITISLILIITILSVLAGLSTAGATGILTLSALTIVLDPVHLPLGAILPLLIAVDTIIDPMRTLTSVYTNCAAVTLVSPREKKSKAL